MKHEMTGQENRIKLVLIDCGKTKQHVSDGPCGILLRIIALCVTVNYLIHTGHN